MNFFSSSSSGGSSIAVIMVVVAVAVVMIIIVMKRRRRICLFHRDNACRQSNILLSFLFLLCQHSHEHGLLASCCGVTVDRL